jgi:Arc/MetJ-type ribon-helix-helix transcriptional regulator
MSGNTFLSPLSVEELFMKHHPGGKRNARIAVRFTSEEQRQVQEAAKVRGYANPSAFIRAAIRNELDGRVELTGTEERIAGGFDRVSKDIFRVGRGQQALYALVDSLVKTVLTCVPEPPIDARPQAIARAKERYERLVKNAGQSMSGDARAAMQDLLGDVAH